MIQPGVNQIQMDYAMGNNPLLWDEFHPNLYTLQATLKKKGVVNVKTESFGMRCINKEGRRFTMNGHPIFLRGTLDCCTFPYTGYPSMNQAYWHKIFSQVKAYGWKASETFEADVQIAHFEESIATSTPIEWKLTNGQSLCYFVLEEGSTTIKQR